MKYPWNSLYAKYIDDPNKKPLTDRKLINRSALLSVLISFFIICIFIPLVNYLNTKSFVFKINHKLKHHVFSRHKFIHRSKLYHNTSLQQFSLWTLIGFSCCYIYSEHNVVEFTKRLGRVSLAMMGPLLFLTLRPSPLPHTLYLSLIPIHKWMGRVIILQSLLHTILYCFYFISTNKMAKIYKMANMCGVVSIVFFFIIMISSISFTRRMSFKWFYFLHYICTVLTIPLLDIHSRPKSRWYTVFNYSMIFFQIIYRISKTNKTKVTVVKISSSLSLMEFPLESLKKQPILPSGHVRINNYHNFFLKRWFYHLVPLQHPFTIASLPNEKNVKLIIRRGNFPLNNDKYYYITGCFEPKIDFISKNFSNNSSLSRLFQKSPLHYNIKARRVMVVVGGSAISFGLPMLRILNFNGVNVRLLWVTRDYKDLCLLNYFKNNFNGMEIYITGDVANEQDLRIDYIDWENHGRCTDNEGEPVGRRWSAGGSADEWDANINNSVGRSPLQGFLNKKKSQGSLVSVDDENEIDFTARFEPLKKRGKKLSDELASETNNDRLDENNTFVQPNETTKLPIETVNSYNSTELSTNTQDLLSSSFRKPAIIIPPDDEGNIRSSKNFGNETKLKIPAGVRLFFGRPNLCDDDYQWCLQKECIGPSDTNECCDPNVATSTHVEDLDNVWVLAAGPVGLVDKTRRWATDHGLHYHEEKFYV